MNTDIIKLNVKTSGANPDFEPSLKCYIPHICTSQKVPEGGRRAVIVCPGGGYAFTSDREAEPIALKFAAEGICAFVLDYSIAPARYPQAVCEAAKAVSIVRANANNWNINPDKIMLCGFSAGGHLAASLGVLFDSSDVLKNTGLTEEECKPNALLLAYPVISGGEFAHKGSFENLTGLTYSSELGEKYSLEKLVKENTPQSFIWHTFEDTTVPVENSILFFSALRKYNINAELHVFPHMAHGLSLANEVTGPVSDEAEIWMQMAIRFIKNL